MCLSAATVFLMSSCGGKRANISGAFVCETGKTIYLEQLMLGTTIMVDSIVSSKSGEFDFTYEFVKNSDPVFLNLRIGNKYISLLVEPGEDVELVSHSNFVKNYTVTGSKGSKLVQDLNLTMSDTYVKIDSLYNLYNSSVDEQQRESILTEIAKKYVDQKKSNIKFLVTNPTSLASLMALYQQMPNGIRIFADAKDFPYYQMIADSLSAHYPTSLNVKSLVKDVEEAQSSNKILNLLNNSLADNPVGMPDIVVNDMYDKPQKLSSLSGKVVLLTFWSAEAGNSNILNRELLEIYNSYSADGFEIFQVSLDTSKSAWVRAIMEQKLPWISVCDFYGAASSAAATFNVRSVPSNYLISRDGDIIGKNIWGDDLKMKLEGAL